MCDIAPFQMGCEFDGCNLLCCRVHHLYQALSNLYQEIPIVKEIVSEYYCPDFKRKDVDND